MRSAHRSVLPEAAALPAPPLASSGGACGGPGEEAGHVGAASAAAAPPPVPAAAAAVSWAESARGPSGARCLRPPGLASAVRPPACPPVSRLRRPAADMATRSCREKAQKLNEQHQLILSKLLREEDNKYCADCEAKGSARAWWPLGRGLLRP